MSLLIPNVKGGAGSPQEAIQIVKYVSSGQIQKVDDYYKLEQVDNHHYWEINLYGRSCLCGKH